LGALAFHRTRLKLASDWRLWIAVKALAVLLIVPWFVYAYVQFGHELWETMFAAHVYERFTTGLNQAHVHPWHYYLGMMAEAFSRSGLQWLIPIGLIVLFAQSARRRWFEGTVVVLWATVQLALISVGSSKLYHYAYPFLPPLTIAAGYVVSLVVMLGPPVVRKLLEHAEDLVARVAPRVSAIAQQRSTQIIGMAVIWIAGGLIVGAIAFGVVRVAAAGMPLFKSSSLIRPLTAVILAGVLMRRSGFVATLAVLLAVGWWMPVSTYKATIRQLAVEKHPLRDARDCLRRVEAEVTGTALPGIYVDTDGTTWHPVYYYFRGLGPWTHQLTPAPEILDRNLHDPASYRPSLVQEDRYREYLHGPEAARFLGGPSPPMIAIRPAPLNYLLLLPGPYRTCSSEAALFTH
jgi:hypothetical protein